MEQSVWDLFLTNLLPLLLANMVAVGAAVLWLPQKLFEHNLEKRIVSMEHSHDFLMKRYDHFSNFSQSTFEKLFQKKVDVYQKLLLVRQEWNSILHEGHQGGEPENIEEGLTQVMLKTKSIIEESGLFVSANLQDAYNNWYEVSKEIFETANIAAREIIQQSWGNEEDNLHASFAEESELKALPKKTAEKFVQIFKALDTDISLIQASLDYSLTADTNKV